MGNRDQATYLYEEGRLGSVVSPTSPGGSAALTEVRWMGLSFSVRDAEGRSLRATAKWGGLAGAWSVHDARGALVLRVGKSPFRRSGHATLSSGEVLAIRGDPRSGVLVTDARGGVIIHMSPETSSPWRARRLTLAVSEKHMPLLSAISLVQAWRLLDRSPSITDPSHSAAQSGSYS